MKPGKLTSAGTNQQVTRVIRASLSRIDGSVMDELFAARARACGPHRAAGLCGSLLYSSGWFVLWLEGPAAAVDEVLRRSAAHGCHSNPRIVHRSVGPASLTEPLTLASTQWPEHSGDFTRRIDAAAGATLLEPGEIWRLLSEPCSLADSDESAASAHRIAVIASEDNYSIDVVRKLADRFRRPVVYQRFATSELHSSDVGAAYVDIPVSGRLTRVQVISRRALGHRMVRDSLRGVQSFALLLGARPAKALDLAAKVGAFVDACASAPAIELVGQCSDTARSVGEYLFGRAQGAISSRLHDMPEAKVLDFLVNGGGDMSFATRMAA